ncbi:MAG: NHL repeat-containing protein [Pseudomonadota bacterium]
MFVREITGSTRHGALVIGALVAMCCAAPITSANAPADGQPLATFKYKWGEPGHGVGQIGKITAITLAPRPESGRTLLVISDGGRDLIRAYTHDLMFIDKWGTTGSNAGEFSEPLGVASTSDGKLWVVDSKNNRVQKTQISTYTLLDRPGEHIMSFGSGGSGPGQFRNPTGVATDPMDNVYVVDTGNSRVQKFSASGEFMGAWGKRGAGATGMKRPTYVAVDPKGFVYVTDTGNNRVVKLDFDLSYVGELGAVGNKAGNLAEPKGVAVDPKGDVWVADRRNHRIQKFAADGAFLGSFGELGSEDGDLSFPEALAIDADGNLYVADTGNHRIQVFDGI